MFPRNSTTLRAETPLSAWLRAVLWGVFLIPLAGFVAASWWSLSRAQTDAANSLSHASELAYRHAERAFAVAEEIAIRVDRATDVSDAEAHAREAEIQQRLSDITAGLNSVVNVNVWDAAGGPLARSDVYPVDRHYTIADRSYFQQQRTSPVTVGVSEVMLGRQTGKQLLNVTRRRTAPDGSFRGLVSVSLSPAFFSSYYRTLESDDPTLATFALIRNDGEILARWPQAAGGSRLPADDPVLERLTAGADAGRLTLAAPGGGDTQLVEFKHVPNAPVYVITGLSRSAMLSNWGRFVGLLAAILAPTTAALVYVTWVALRKTREEQAVSAELAQEIGARGAAERKMLESQKFETLAFVTGSVAHDFNNLLAVISSSLHVYKRRRADAGDDRHLAAIARAVQSGVRLTRQLLSFSQKQALRPEVVSLQGWLASADVLLQSTLGSGAHWSSVVDADTRPVKVDIGELELALINIVMNAKHAMPQGGSLRVHASNDLLAEPDAPMVLIAVTDTGEGIPADVLPRIFEPFFTTRKKGVGSGLGLSQVHGFCVQSGGRASIHSTPGQGTTVCLHLPASSEAALDADRAPPASTGQLDARLLLVEDNEEVGKTTEQMLRSSGLTVQRVLDADAALAYLAGVMPAPRAAGAPADPSGRSPAAPQAPDVVLSDIAMPGSMNGIGLALELARLYPDLPVMLTTGYAEQISQGTAKGMRVFQKPVPPEELLAHLQALVEGRRRESVS